MILQTLMDTCATYIICRGLCTTKISDYKFSQIYHVEHFTVSTGLVLAWRAQEIYMTLCVILCVYYCDRIQQELYRHRSDEELRIDYVSLHAITQ